MLFILPGRLSHVRNLTWWVIRKLRQDRKIQKGIVQEIVIFLTFHHYPPSLLILLLLLLLLLLLPHLHNPLYKAASSYSSFFLFFFTVFFSPSSFCYHSFKVFCLKVNWPLQSKGDVVPGLTLLCRSGLSLYMLPRGKHSSQH